MNDKAFTIDDMIDKQKTAKAKEEDIVHLQMMKAKVRSQESAQAFDKVIEIKSRQLALYYFPTGMMFEVPQMEFFVDGEITIGEVSLEER